MSPFTFTSEPLPAPQPGRIAVLWARTSGRQHVSELVAEQDYTGWIHPDSGKRWPFPNVTAIIGWAPLQGWQPKSTIFRAEQLTHQFFKMVDLNDWEAADRIIVAAITIDLPNQVLNALAMAAEPFATHLPAYGSLMGRLPVVQDDP